MVIYRCLNIHNWYRYRLVVKDHSLTVPLTIFLPWYSQRKSVINPREKKAFDYNVMLQVNVHAAWYSENVIQPSIEFDKIRSEFTFTIYTFRYEVMIYQQPTDEIDISPPPPIRKKLYHTGFGIHKPLSFPSPHVLLISVIRLTRWTGIDCLVGKPAMVPRGK